MKEVKISKDQKTLFYTLIQNNGLREHKEDMVLQYTDGRTSHVSDMTQEEFTALIKVLKESDPADRMRKKIWAIAYDLKWIYPGDATEMKMNAAKLNAFFRTRGVVKKELFKMSKVELTKAVSQMENIKRKGIIHDLKSILEEAGIANDIRYNEKNKVD